MYDRRIKNVEIFMDTEKVYRTNAVLQAAIRRSIECQQLVLESAEIEYVEKQDSQGKVVVSGKRSLEASEVYAKQGKKVCVLNFASATNPGGGVGSWGIWLWGFSKSTETGSGSVC